MSVSAMIKEIIRSDTLYNLWSHELLGVAGVAVRSHDISHLWSHKLLWVARVARPPGAAGRAPALDLPVNLKHLNKATKQKEQISAQRAIPVKKNQKYLQVILGKG